MIMNMVVDEFADTYKMEYLNINTMQKGRFCGPDQRAGSLL